MNEKDKQVIESYQNDEKMMILIYSQWCINNELDPVELYEKAYPGQLKNNALIEIIGETVPAKESAEITDQTVLNVLQLFGNDDLAFIVQEHIEKRDN
ncbi:hypothetical protein [Oceanobacillus profundus]|uniref:hypothetical protein n=1 Tax=Oceanobacillus TaxID=182709 RepID=UPI0026E1F30D|nr:hypothetical protein [Oceanobacillus profundus]MDO6450614.1 hypothetical protein [Oceanobacillus profundus]